MSKETLVVTRIHGNISSKLPSKEQILNFVISIKGYVSNLLICLGGPSLEFLQKTLQDYQGLEESSLELGLNLKILPISPWGIYTTALNQAIFYAQTNQYKYIIFQSFEYSIHSLLVSRLLSFFTSNPYLLVIGPEIQGHDFQTNLNLNETNVELRGRTCPWNTFAIWDLEKISLTGFPLIGDGSSSNRSCAGVEEFSLISLLQSLYPNFEAKLIRFVNNLNASSNWVTDFGSDTQRAAYHNQKMLSKDERPQQQFDILRNSKFGDNIQFQRGNISHITLYEEDILPTI